MDTNKMHSQNSSHIPRIFQIEMEKLTHIWMVRVPGAETCGFARNTLPLCTAYCPLQRMVILTLHPRTNCIIIFFFFKNWYCRSARTILFIIQHPISEFLKSIYHNHRHTTNPVPLIIFCQKSPHHTTKIKTRQSLLHSEIIELSRAQSTCLPHDSRLSRQGFNIFLLGLTKHDISVELNTVELNNISKRVSKSERIFVLNFSEDALR